jgi:hypothetical protein
MITELSIDAYESTLTERMVNITGIAGPAAEIWLYAKELADQHIIPGAVLEKKAIEIIYQNEDKTFDHVLLPAENENVFIVIVIDLLQKKIAGHYRQDLNEVYGTE